MLGPDLIIIAWLLFEFEPPGLVFPASDKVDTPDHDKEWVDEISGTIIGGILQKIVEDCGK